MLPIVVCAAVIGAPLHLEADLPDDASDYVLLDFTVPAGTVELEIAHTDGSAVNILDWGLWSPSGFRGYAGGLEDPAVVGADASSRGYLPGPIAPGPGWKILVGKAKIEAPPAHYAIDVTFRDAPTLAAQTRAPYSPVVLSTGPRWYAGDFHVHSEQSGDASATFAEIAAFARGKRLDFVVLSDHNTVAQHGLAAALQPSLPDLLLVRGMELTTYAGHGNALGIAEHVDWRIGFAGLTTAQAIDAVNRQGGLFIVNHPALELGTACIGCAWRHDDAPWAAIGAIEIQTGPWDLTASVFTPRAIAMWDARLDGGARLTAVGGSDDHKAGIDETAFQSPIASPTTLVHASELSEAGILEALRAGRAIVKLRGPDDPTVELTAGGVGGTGTIGDTVTGQQLTFTAHVVGGNGMYAELWRDGVMAAFQTVDRDDWTGAFADAATAPGPTRFRLQLSLAGQPVVVTNHIWAQFVGIDPVDPPGQGGGCGCRAARDGGGPGPWAALIVLLLAARAATSRARAFAPSRRG